MRLFPLFITLITIKSCDFLDLYDYCNPELKLCDIPSSHTMCQYPTGDLSPDCGTSVDDQLSDSDKQFILSLHNQLRRDVATGAEKNSFGSFPVASNMRKMYWDPELEEIAVRWARQCFNGDLNIHDDCRNTKRFNVSQNVGTTTNKDYIQGKNIAQIFQVWHNKKHYLNPDDIDFYSSIEADKETEEFINLIRADTHSIGCSRLLYVKNTTGREELEDDDLWIIESMICNYGPGVNKLGGSIYKRGAPCSDCPEGSTCSADYPGLCYYHETEHTTTNLGLGIADNRKVKLTVGTFFNGMCHCPDISRFGMKKEKVNTSSRVKGPKIFGTSQGALCYCREYVENGADRSEYPLYIQIICLIVLSVLNKRRVI